MWQEDLLRKVDRQKGEITFDPHAFQRTHYWNLDLAKVEETVRSGQVFLEKCEPPNKLCFQRYFGKENVTSIGNRPPPVTDGWHARPSGSGRFPRTIPFSSRWPGSPPVISSHCVRELLTSNHWWKTEYFRALPQ